MRKHSNTIKFYLSFVVIFMRIFLLLSFLLSYSTTSTTIRSDSDHKNDFDYLTFTQSWPITVCINWMTTNDENACNLPKQRDSWTIHGVWPSKRASIGPEFCENDSPIQMNTMQSIIERLRQNWPNLKKGNFC